MTDQSNAETIVNALLEFQTVDDEVAQLAGLLHSLGVPVVQINFIRGRIVIFGNVRGSEQLRSFAHSTVKEMGLEDRLEEIAVTENGFTIAFRPVNHDELSRAE